MIKFTDLYWISHINRRTVYDPKRNSFIIFFSATHMEILFLKAERQDA